MSEKINQNGRSILEMLGILAIVGILSVGGIASYSRAMMKYKLNKQLVQYTAIITGSYQLARLRDAAGNKNVNITRFMINSGGVPSAGIFQLHLGRHGQSNLHWHRIPVFFQNNNFTVRKNRRSDLPQHPVFKQRTKPDAVADSFCTPGGRCPFFKL